MVGEVPTKWSVPGFGLGEVVGTGVVCIEELGWEGSLYWGQRVMSGCVTQAVGGDLYCGKMSLGRICTRREYVFVILCPLAC